MKCSYFVQNVINLDLTVIIKISLFMNKLLLYRYYYSTRSSEVFVILILINWLSSKNHTTNHFTMVTLFIHDTGRILLQCIFIHTSVVSIIFYIFYASVSGVSTFILTAYIYIYIAKLRQYF